MSNCLNKIKDRRKTILTGEIGALLHDIGKCHPDFIKKQSLEDAGDSHHHARDIDKFIKLQLLIHLKDKKFNVKINGNEKNVYDFIKEHSNANGTLLKLLAACDKKDSADDKGIVRKKQSLENTIIASPFGYSKEKIDLHCLQKRFEDLEDRLKNLLTNYISGAMDISCFRRSLISDLKATFSHALGETRIPSNDVTLWDHSYSTASLFKSVLSAMVCGDNPDHQKLKWRIFGISWDGIGFINKGKKVAEIQKRGEVIENVKKELKKKFEDEIPIGNAIYEDLNGVYFTFPALSNNKSKELAKECAKQALKIIYDKSDKELWPIFTLSKASRSLTIIAGELKFSANKRNIPKMSPTLFIKDNSEEKIEFIENTELPIPEEKHDICPVCRIRTKPVKNERCDICNERSEGRLEGWLSNREKTVWIDEAADRNNRVALISLNFNLDKWLDGTMIGTIYSQSFEDWLDKVEKTIEEMKKAEDHSKIKDQIDKKNREKNKLEQKMKLSTFTLNPDKKTVYGLLDLFFKMKNNDKETPAKILNTFFEENIRLNKSTLDNHIKNIEERLSDRTFNKENLATYLFTQNPSPARLYRIWRETEEFLDLIIQEIEDKIYSNKWKRIKFSVDLSDLKSNLIDGQEIEPNTPYIVKVNGLKPENLLVLNTQSEKFYTIESLEKFEFNNKTGEEGIKEALKKGFSHLALEDDASKNLLQGKVSVDENNITSEKYLPLIEINNSPISLRLIVPALDSLGIIELITKLYNERFEKVLAKLPLTVKLLVTKKKFPLYILLDAEKRMLDDEEFKKQKYLNPWWNIDGLRDDKYYGYYPTKSTNENEKYTLDDLSKLSKGKIFSFYPGYFDFDLLLGSTDRYKIIYDKKGGRAPGDYKLFTARPYYFYQLSDMLELWDILLHNLSNSQINFIEEILANKLRRWREVDDRNKQNIFRDFATATLKSAFGNKWNKLRDETRYFLINSACNKLLLDTIILFRHILKAKEVD